MEPLKIDVPKLPNMVPGFHQSGEEGRCVLNFNHMSSFKQRDIMCGDHPSITKTDLNLKDPKLNEDKEKDDKEKRLPMTYARISPTSSRERTLETERLRVRTTSEHALRALAKQRSLENVYRPDIAAAHGNRELVQAALGSFRWPPYLVCVWVLVLVLTHALHCVVAVLDKALPAVRKVCHYFRTWTEESWKREVEFNQRLYPIGLACLTGLLYTLYCALLVAHGLALWAVEPLSAELDDKPGMGNKPSVGNVPTITDYVDAVGSATNTCPRQ